MQTNQDVTYVTKNTLFNLSKTVDHFNFEI